MNRENLIELGKAHAFLSMLELQAEVAIEQLKTLQEPMIYKDGCIDFNKSFNHNNTLSVNEANYLLTTVAPIYSIYQEPVIGDKILCCVYKGENRIISENKYYFMINECKNPIDVKIEIGATY